MRGFKADMHIHACLSPCSDWEMSPKRIVEKSHQKGLDIIAICDHNSAENVGATIVAGEKRGIEVLPGMEVCSREEVHIIALFEKLEQALVMQEYVYAHLPEENQPALFGDQWVVNENDEFLRENPRLLIGATQLGLNEIVEKIHSLDGLSIASHVDRPAFGIISQLGFIPPDLKLDGIEVSRHITPEEAREKIAGIGNLPCVTSTDAHYLDDIGGVWTTFKLAEPTIKEIRLAFKNEKGRSIEV
jgi:hypothetical protein